LSIKILQSKNHEIEYIYLYKKVNKNIEIELGKDIHGYLKFSLFLLYTLYNSDMRQLKINKSITNRESASLDKYLHEIAKEELVSVDQEVELAQRIKK